MSLEEQQLFQQRLDRLDDKLDEIYAAVNQQQATCTAARSRLESVCLALYGNGRPLLGRMRPPVARMGPQLAGGHAPQLSNAIANHDRDLTSR